MADYQIAVLRGDNSDIIFGEKNSYRQKHLKQVELWSRKQIKKQVCQKKDDTPAFKRIFLFYACLKSIRSLS